MVSRAHSAAELLRLEDEQVVTALPKVKPLVSQSARIDEIAAAQGLSAHMVKTIAASYWQETGGVSPVEQRVECLEQFWHAFDEIHARQRPKMNSLWGLINQDRLVILNFWEGRDLFRQDLWRELLPQGLLTEIEELRTCRDSPGRFSHP
jgi:hypothetical protein